MKNRFNKPGRSIGISHRPPLKRSSAQKPMLPVNAHEPHERTVTPDDSQWEACQMHFPYILEDGTVLFWTAVTNQIREDHEDD